MAFVKFTNVRSRIDTPKVSIWTRGQIGFNQGSVDEYGIDKYGYAILYYDEESRSVGVELSNDPKADGAAKLVKGKNAGTSFSARAFLKHYKIDFSETKQYALERDDDNGLLILDLNNPL